MAFEKQSKTKMNFSKENCLPRCYKDTAKILKIVKACTSNLKTAIYNSRHRGQYLKKVHALSLNVLKHNILLQKIIEETQLLEKESSLKKEIVQILIYELTLGKGSIPGKSNTASLVMNYHDDIMRAYGKLQKAAITNGQILGEAVPSLPRYARINTLITSVPYVLKDLKEKGYEQLIYAEDILEDEYLDVVRSLQAPKFLIDYHFKDLLVFPRHENVTSSLLYKNGLLLLQDKSSYIPVHVLAPEPGCIVIDACAAPGMKAMHLAAKMKNKGVMYAYEKSNERYKVLQDMLEHGCVKVAKTFCDDFRRTDPHGENMSAVNYILLDPTCSGSGMVSRMDTITDTKDSKNLERLQKLAGFQLILLKHALKFPSVKRVVYSTCSTTEEENEHVVQEALQSFSSEFRLVHIMPEWSVRGSKNYECGHLCIRAYPEKNLTNGFFVAMFERVEDNLDMSSDISNLKRNTFLNIFEEEKTDEVAVNKKKKKNKNLKKVPSYENSEVGTENDSCKNLEVFPERSTDELQKQVEEKNSKKRRKKRKIEKSQNIPFNKSSPTNANYECYSSVSEENLKDFPNSDISVPFLSQHCKKKKRDKKPKSLNRDSHENDKSPEQSGNKRSKIVL